MICRPSLWLCSGKDGVSLPVCSPISEDFVNKGSYQIARGMTDIQAVHASETLKIGSRARKRFENVVWTTYVMDDHVLYTHMPSNFPANYDYFGPKFSKFCAAEDDFSEGNYSTLKKSLDKQWSYGEELPRRVFSRKVILQSFAVDPCPTAPLRSHKKIVILKIIKYRFGNMFRHEEEDRTVSSSQDEHSANQVTCEAMESWYERVPVTFEYRILVRLNSARIVRIECWGSTLGHWPGSLMELRVALGRIMKKQLLVTDMFVWYVCLRVCLGVCLGGMSALQEADRAALYLDSSTRKILIVTAEGQLLKPHTQVWLIYCCWCFWSCWTVSEHLM